MIFVFLSFDEAFAIHDQMVFSIRKRLTNDLGGLLYEGWVIPYSALVAFLSVYFLKFVLALPKKIRTFFIIAGIIYLLGALGFEFLEGYEEKRNGHSLAFWWLNTIEEFLEISGITFFIYALLRYMSPLNFRIISQSRNLL